MVLVSAATAGCGLLMLGGVGPTGSGAMLPGDLVAAVAPDTSSPTTSTSTTSTTTTTVTTSTTTTVTTMPTTTVPPSPVPIGVSASQRTVGAGGVVTFSGQCPLFDGAPLGPVVLWVVGVGSSEISTGVTSERWTYAWTAPVDEAEFSAFTFQFWCGDPAGFDGGYPSDLQQIVDMVAAAPPTTTSPLIESEPPVVIIPETD